MRLSPPAIGACFVLAAVVSSGCEHGITLAGTVTVPVDLQRHVSPRDPAVVRLSASLPKSAGFSYRLAALCEPSGADVVLPVLHDDFGCAREGTLRAELVRPAAGDAPPCGVAQTRWDGAAAQVLAAGEQVVFTGQRGRLGCSNGADTVSIVVQPLP